MSLPSWSILTFPSLQSAVTRWSSFSSDSFLLAHGKRVKWWHSPKTAFHLSLQQQCASLLKFIHSKNSDTWSLKAKIISDMENGRIRSSSITLWRLARFQGTPWTRYYHYEFWIRNTVSLPDARQNFSNLWGKTKQKIATIW